MHDEPARQQDLGQVLARQARLGAEVEALQVAHARLVGELRFCLAVLLTVAAALMLRHCGAA